jgi:hypothetical protein
MNENLAKCVTPPPPQQETLSSLVASLVEITIAIGTQVESINCKLFGLRPCETENQPVIDDMESALRLVRTRMETIAKDVYSINERL